MRSRCLSSRSLSPLAGLALIVVALGGCQDGQAPTAPDGAPQAGTAASPALTFRQLSAGGAYTCGVTTDDRAFCWGWNQFGQLGDGTDGTLAENRPEPVAVVGDLRFRNVSADGYHSCGVTTDGLAYCWGFNGNGQLGDGTTTDQLVPVAVAGGLGFRTVSPAGSSHTCGLTTDDRAFCWGSNEFGQLGDGTTTDRPTPTAVLGGLTFKEVSAGGSHACGLATAGRVYCWGSNEYGQLGDSSEVAFSATPVRVIGARRYVQMDAGPGHTCAVAVSSRVFCWGYNPDGQLGNGTTDNSSWPIRVARGIPFERVTAGGLVTCAETSDNRAYCWGDNDWGEIGDGTTKDRLKPVAVSGGLFFTQLTAGGYHVCGRKGGGAGFCWGGNPHGQLGDGTLLQHTTPAPVVGPN